MPEHGRIPNPLDEEQALALLREGRAMHSVAAELQVGMRRIRALAEAHGIPIRHKRTEAEIAAQSNRIRELRGRGRSWRQIAEEFGYANPDGALSGIWRRANREGLAETDAPRHAKSIRSMLRRLRKANGGRADWYDLASFVRMAGNPRMHWLLRPAEIELARDCRLLPAGDMGTPAEILIERSLHEPPSTPRPTATIFLG